MSLFAILGTWVSCKELAYKEEPSVLLYVNSVIVYALSRYLSSLLYVRLDGTEGEGLSSKRLELSIYLKLCMANKNQPLGEQYDY